MRLSEFTTEQALDVFCEITPYVTNIVTDDELLGELRNAVNLDGATTRAEQIAILAEKVTKLIPILLKKRKTDLLSIVAVLDGKTLEEVEKQNILVTMIQIRGIFKDKALLDFFKSCVNSEGSE